MHFRKEEEENYSLDLTPLIDVVFLLLIFFMVSTVFVDFTRRMDISLPESKSSVLDERSKKFEIEMTRDKQIFLNGEKQTFASIEKLLSASSDNEKKVAIIKADKELPYGQVIKLMGILQGADVRNISVAVKN